MKFHLLFLTLFGGLGAPAQLPDGPGNLAPRTVVLYNANQPASRELAEYYAKQRNIPGENLVGLKCAEAETIKREEFKSTIDEPLREIFTKRGWWETGDSPGGKICTRTRMRVFALMRGLPLRIDEQPVYGPEDPKTGKKPVVPPANGKSNAASVDSELMTFGILDKHIEGPLRNPYFEKSEPFLTQPLAPIFLTGRLDGPTDADARRLIDDALAVEKTGLYGRVYVDLAKKDTGGYKEGEEWLMKAAQTFGASGFPVIVDSRALTFPQNYPMRDCAVYLGWYQLPPDGPFLHPEFKFKRGAIACHIHSFSATTVRSTKEGWVGLMVSQGAAGVFGNVYEPFLSLTAHLDILSDRLLRGFTLAEAHAMSLPAGSWMAVVLGDPLYRPFAAPIADAAADKDFRTLRLLMKEHSEQKTENRDLLNKLVQAATTQRSGNLWEMTALLGQGMMPDDRKSIRTAFANAVAAFRAPQDKIRVSLLQAEWHLSGEEKKEAAAVLAAAAKLAEKLPELKAIETMRTEWKLGAAGK